MSTLISRDRSKLIQAINYFATNTRFCAKTKLFKLLYFLDFEHFKQTGRNVTGLNYFAWPKGPVPVALFEEFGAPAPDLLSSVRIEQVKLKNGIMFQLLPCKEFDPQHFTKRELQILENLATIYKAAKADDMIESTHLENRPWHRVYEVEGRPQQAIPYEYAINAQESGEMRAIVDEREAIVTHFSRR